jgi:polysaccharide export outer membrane protein
MVRPARSHSVLTFVVASLASLSVACSSSVGGSIPVSQYVEAADPPSGEYVIVVGDLLVVQVWDQPQMSGKMKVRSDGRITLPFVNDIEAAGKTPSKLAGDLEAGLKSVILAPKVTVFVEESTPPTISMMGEIGKPGPMPLARDMGVAQAIAAAGGLTTFAHRDRIFVVRSSPKPVRIHFTYKELTQEVGTASKFRLKPGDIVVVE